jgi:hypothetical protein
MGEGKNIQGAEPKDQNQDPDSSREENVHAHFPEDPGLDPAYSLQPQTINLPAGQAGDKPGTSNMEVHQHSHSHGKKNWKAYFWEFLMLFLAVFCGFLAENQREHMVEHQRELQYMKSLLIDLKKDEADLQMNISKGWITVAYNDSLSLELQKKPLQGREKRIYHFLLLYSTIIDFTYHDKTITQLKNSGGFRMVRNQKVSDALLDYDTYMLKSIELAQGWWTNNLVSTDIRIGYQLFESYRVRKLLDSALAHINEMDKVPYPRDLKLLSYDDNIIKQFLNSMSYVLNSDALKYKRAIEAFAMNKSLDSLIKKEYHLK